MPGDSTYDFDGDFAVSIPRLMRNAPDRDNNLYAGDAVSETFGVIVSKTIFLQALLLARGTLVFGRLNCFDDDIERTESFDSLHSISAGAFTDGKHRDYGCDAEYYAKGGKRRTKAMKP
jgi:hypothetical protein